jgi:3-oxoacyl-[acyl-carrier protein] reductase
MSEGRVALVTGAGRGLGREIAIRLAAVCAGVAVHYHQDREAAEETAAAVRGEGKSCHLFPADLTSENQAAGLIRGIEETFGRLDILVNNVGPIITKPWLELTGEDWEKMFRGVLESGFFCMKAALPGMGRRGWGRVVNIGYSRAEKLGSFPTITAYAAAKTSLLILTRTAAVSKAGTGITINMVSPGLLEGGMLPSSSKINPKSIGTYADVAKAVLFLVSDEATQITGTNLIVAGTWMM